MDFSELIKYRKSVRGYKSEEVSDETINEIFKEVRYAPSAKNLQPWYFYVIKNSEIIKSLKDTYDKEWFYNAPVVIIACVDYDSAWENGYTGKNYGDVDLSIIFDHLTLSAANKGLGTCWIGAFDPAKLESVFQIRKGLTPLLLTPLGRPLDAEKVSKKRKEINEIMELIK